MLSVSRSVVDHSVIIQALKKGLTEHEASDTGGVPRWKSSCPDRLAEATARQHGTWVNFSQKSAEKKKKKNTPDTDDRQEVFRARNPGSQGTTYVYELLN